MQHPERFLDIKYTISIIAIVVIINVEVKKASAEFWVDCAAIDLLLH